MSWLDLISPDNPVGLGLWFIVTDLCVVAYFYFTPDHWED